MLCILKIFKYIYTIRMNNVYKTLNYYAYVINIMTVFTQKPTSRFSIGPCKMQLQIYNVKYLLYYDLYSPVYLR